MSNPYATSETPADLWLERSLYAGNAMGCMAYGMHILVYFMTMQSIYAHLKRRALWFQALCVTTLFISGTLCLIMEIYYGQKAWIDLRGFPGGPLGYILNAEAQPINTVGAIFSTIIVLVGDALLIWRAYIIWGSKWYIIAFPVLHWLVIGVLGFIFAWNQSLPASSLYSSITEEVGLPYFSLEMALNILCTILIIAPLLRARQHIIKALGQHHGQLYTSIVAIIIESALPNAVFSLLWVILYAKQNTAENLFITVLIQIQCIAPEMIILRIANGRAWDSSTHDKISARVSGSDSQTHGIDAITVVESKSEAFPV